MHTKAIALTLLIIASSLAGCTTSEDIETIDQDNRITELENKQLELVLSLAEQEQTNSDLLASISLIETANMQAIKALEDDYLDSLNELETSYLAAMEAAAVVNSQSLDEINSTNAASYDNLLLTMNTLQSNLQGSQDSINAIILTIDDMDSDDSGDSLAQILLLQQTLLDLQLDLESSISNLDSRLNETRAINDFSYLDSLNELETSYLAAMEAAAVVNSQSLDEINSTNAASYDNLLLTMNTLQSNLQGSQDSINAIILTIDDMDSDDSGDSLAQILLLQQTLLDLQLDLESSISNLDSRLNQTRAINDFSYLDFRGAQLFNFNNGLGIMMDPPIFDFANLMNASLSYSNFSNASFRNANLAGGDGLFSTFHNTDFSGAQMQQGIWRQSEFNDALFVGSQLFYTEFRYSDLSGANLSGAYAYGGSDWLMVNLSGADLTNTWMYDVDLRYADLTGADLTGARLAYLNPSYGPADITGVTWDWATCPDGTAAYYHGQTCENNL